MTAKKVSTYKTLESVIVEILKQQKAPISAGQLENIVHNNYRVGRITTNPRSLAQRMKTNPNIRHIHRGDRNLYFFNPK